MAGEGKPLRGTELCRCAGIGARAGCPRGGTGERVGTARWTATPLPPAPPPQPPQGGRGRTKRWWQARPAGLPLTPGPPLPQGERGSTTTAKTRRTVRSVSTEIPLPRNGGGWRLSGRRVGASSRTPAQTLREGCEREAARPAAACGARLRCRRQFRLLRSRSPTPRQRGHARTRRKPAVQVNQPPSGPVRADPSAGCQVAISSMRCASSKSRSVTPPSSWVVSFTVRRG